MNVTFFGRQLTLFGNTKGKVQRKWYQNRGALSIVSPAVLIHWGLGCDLNPPQTPTLIQCEPVAPTITPLSLCQDKMGNDVLKTKHHFLPGPLSLTFSQSTNASPI